MKTRHAVALFLFLIGAALELLAVAQPHFSETKSDSSVTLELGPLSTVLIEMSEPLENITVSFSSYAADDKNYTDVHDAFQFMMGETKIFGSPVPLKLGVPGIYLQYEGVLEATTIRFLRYPLGEKVFLILASKTGTPITVYHHWDEYGYRMLVMIVVAVVFAGLILSALSYTSAAPAPTKALPHRPMDPNGNSPKRPVPLRNTRARGIPSGKLRRS